MLTFIVGAMADNVVHSLDATCKKCKHMQECNTPCT